MGLLEGKVAVISGATSGIGAASAKLLSEEGAVVVCVARDAQKGNALVQEIAADGGRAEFWACDVSNEAQVKELSAYVGEKYRKVDILFNNAGIMPPSAEIENMLVQDWHNAFDVCVDGVFYVTRNLKKYIVGAKGCIVNNASIAGMHSYVVGRSYAYSAAKAAVIQFTRQMAKNYAEAGVRVNCVCPGIIDTPILGDRDRGAYAERVPMGYVGAPLDVARVVLFLASEYSAYVTGAVIPVDGGVSLGGGKS